MPSRRNFLFGIGGALVGFAAATPLTPALQKLTSLWFKIANNPKTLTNVEVDVSFLSPGESMAVPWQGKVIYVLRRSPELISRIENSDDEEFYDPLSEQDFEPFPDHFH